MCSNITQCMDLKTPRNVHLSGFYKRSFAHHTVKNRMPLILTKIIDGLVREKSIINEEYGDEGTDDLKHVIGELSKLKYEIQTNKPIRHITTNAADAAAYNKYISGLTDREGTVTYFSTIWLLSECYMYRRIHEAFELTVKLQNYDLFFKQKQEAYFQAESIMAKLGEYLQSLADAPEPTKEDLVQLLKSNLWGNKCDLSLTNGVIDTQSEKSFNLALLDPHILSDHSDQVWEALSDTKGSDILDFVFDNSGYEVFTDLCLADYIISKGLAQTVRFYVKTIPWFISDVMLHDFHWVIDQLKDNENTVLQQLGEKWGNYFAANKWIVIQNNFWTLPMGYTEMSSVNSSLYQQLSEAKLVIFKGDLNYRKLFNDKNWDPTTPVVEGLQGFHPTKICALRTIKSDIVCGLKKGVAEKTEAVDAKWMETGDYGLIQFCDKIVPLI